MTCNQLIIVLIITVAAIFRFWNLEERTLFSGEATNELNSIDKLVSGEVSPLVGLYAATYVPGELHTTPWFLYVMAPVLLLFRGNPVAFMVLHPLLGIISIYFLYRAVSMLASLKAALPAEERPTSRERIVHEAGEWQAKAGLIAATLYATWMTIVDLDRSVWSLGLIPMTVNFVLFAAVQSWRTQKPKWFLLLGVLLGFSISLHLQMLATVVFTLSWVFFTTRQSFRWTLLPIALSFLPLAIFDLTHHFQILAAFPKTIVSLVDGTRPYPTSYFIYQFFPLFIAAAGVALSRIPQQFAFIIIGGFILIQTRVFLLYSTHPNFIERRALVHDLLKFWTPEEGLTVFINDRSYFEYGYLLLYYGRDQGVRSDNVTKLEHPQPTQQLIEKVRAKAKEIADKESAFQQIKNKESLLLLDEDRLKLLSMSAFRFDINDTRKTVSPPE